MNQPWKLIVVLIGIFAAGGVTGGFIALRLGHPNPPQHPSPEDWAPRQLKRLTDRLDLTPAQQELVRPIVRRNMEELRKVRSHSTAETKGVFERMAQEISEQLTPEQRVKFDQFNKEMRERADNARRAMGDRGEHFGEGHPPRDKDAPPPPEKP